MASYRPVPRRGSSLDTADFDAAAGGTVGVASVIFTPSASPEVENGGEPATFPESESGPSFGTPEWEEDERKSGSRTSGTLLEDDNYDDDEEEEEEGVLDANPSRNVGPVLHSPPVVHTGHHKEQSVVSAHSSSRDAGGGREGGPLGQGGCPNRGSEDGDAAGAKPPPKVLRHHRPPYIDYSYTRRVASPLKRRPSILIAATAAAVAAAAAAESEQNKQSSHGASEQSETVAPGSRGAGGGGIRLEQEP